MTNLKQNDPFRGLPVSDRSVRRAGAILIVVMFGVCGAWAALAPLNGAAYAPGVVTVQTYRKTVQHLEGGIVKEILVHDGDTVSRGDPLIILDDAQLRSEYEMTRNQLIAAQAAEDRLIAERDNLQTIVFRGIAALDDARSAEARRVESLLFEARRAARLGQVAVLREKAQQLREQIKGTDEMMGTKRNLQASYSSEISELSDLLSQGFIDKQRMLEQTRKLDMLKSELADHRSANTRTRLQINETELQMLQVRMDFNADTTKQLAEVHTNVYDLQEKASALEERLNRVVIRAPDDGMVIGMSVHTLGGVVRAATPLLDIVPSDTDLIVEAQLSTTDVDRVAVGKLATIRFNSFNSSTTPVIEGRVISISADRLISDETGAAYYLARVAITAAGAQKLSNRKLLAGMSADVLIDAGERTVLQYLLQPARNAVAQSMIEE